MAAILNAGNQSTSVSVRSVRDVFGRIENVRVAVGIVSPPHFGQRLFPLLVSVTAILNSVNDRRHEMSGDIGSVISKSGLVKNVGVEVEIASLSQAVQKLLPLPFSRPPSRISGRRRRRIFPGMAPLKIPYLKIEYRHRIPVFSWPVGKVRGGAKLRC